MTQRVRSADHILNAIQARKERLRADFGLKSLGLFGSWARNEQAQQSDIDLLVEFDRTTFDNYMDLKLYLEDLFGGRIDLVLKSSLKPALRESILSEVRYAP